LLRLRSEVGTLRRQTNELGQQLAANHASKPSLASQGSSPTAPESVPKESWAFIGYANPESALQSTIWAMNQGDTKTYLASLVPDAPELTQLRGFEDKNLQTKTETELASKIKAEFEKVTAFRIIGKELVNDDEVLLSVYADGVNEGGRFRFKRIGSDWKFAGPVKGQPPPDQ
jgi:hypothetical protein